MRRCWRFAALFGLVSIVACGPPPSRELTVSGTIPTSWDEVFSGGEPIDLELPPDGPPLLKIGQIAILPEGGFVVPDARGKRILVFDRDGGLAREIHAGEGGEVEATVIRAVTLDPRGRLLVFDPDGNRITVLPIDGGPPLPAFEISVPAADLVALPDETIVAYSPGETRAFHRFDREGNRLGDAYRVRDEDLRIFHGRVQTGGVARAQDGEIFGIHPTAFELVRLSPDLEVLELLRSGEGNRWQPSPPDFPDGLSPFDYTPRHEAWWDSFVHIGRIHALLDDVLAVTVFSSRTLWAGTESVNLYRTDGETLALGLRVPREGRVVGAKGREVLVARDASLGDDDTLKPLALYRYRVRPDAFQ
jgi:hypothetical protein